MTAPPVESNVKPTEVNLRREELSLERAKLFIEFAKFGFRGTLTAALGSLILIFGLAVLSAFSTFKVDSWLLGVLSVLVLVGSIAFGYLSLWELPKVGARIEREQLHLSVGSGRAGDDQKGKAS